MQPVICPQCSPHLAHMREIAASGLKNMLDCAEEMKTEIDTLPDDLKPFGEALADFIMQVLIESYVETLKLISDLGIQKIAQAGIPPTPHTEPDLLKRRNSNGI
jgi:hypothetical protein